MPDPAEFLTVREVMDLLRLGRTTVYSQARLYLATGGTAGIPCRKFGRSLRFPAIEIRHHAGLPIDAPTPSSASLAPSRPSASPASIDQRSAPTRPAARTRPAPKSQSRRTASTRTDDTVVQAVLPFTD